MHTQKGFSSVAILIGVVAIIIIGGGYYISQQPSSEDAMVIQSEVEGMEDNAMMEKLSDAEAMEGKEDGDVMMEGDAMPIPPVPSENEGSGAKGMTSYAGTVLAGNKALLLDFNKADYDKAIKSDKVVALYFYANWCPICRAEFPKMQAAFDELATDKVIGFRVNFNDNETDSNEEALASQFGVAYQHTKVFVKNGERILKSPEGWDKNRYLSEISTALK